MPASQEPPHEFFPPFIGNIFFFSILRPYE